MFRLLLDAIERTINWLSDRGNQIVLALAVLFSVVGGWGFYFAISHFDFMGSRFAFRFSCADLKNWPAAAILISLFVFAFVALVTIGDTMRNIDNRRHGYPAEWGNTLMFGGVALVGGIMFYVVMELSC